eukprot:1736871-Rhodomonas_salina.1
MPRAVGPHGLARPARPRRGTARRAGKHTLAVAGSRRCQGLASAPALARAARCATALARADPRHAVHGCRTTVVVGHV